MKRHLVLLFLPVLLLANGPDRGGYRWIDSDAPGGPQFGWIEISESSGTRIPLADDDNQGPFALGFALDFYGHLRDSIRVCSNGWLSFTSGSHQFHHHPFPDTRDPNSLIAPLWTDLDPSQGGSVYCDVDLLHRRFVVSWIDVPFHGTGDSCTFQVVLDTSGDIVFQYLRLPTLFRLGTDSCSVGIENDSGLVGLEYLCDGSPVANQLHDSLAVRFYRLRLDVCPTAVLRPMQQVMAEDSIAPLVVVRNTGLDTATFPTTLKIGSAYQETMTVADLAPLTDKALQFPVWVPGADTYALEFITSLGGDEYQANDTLRAEIVSSYTGELKYDDGEADTWFIKNGSPANEWAGAVRFSVPYSRFRLLGARVFAAETTPFSKILVCPDSGGAPKVSSPYLLAESVAAGQPETWLEVAADTMVTATEDLWLVAFWQQRATEPRIGEDGDAPIDRRSYFGSPTVRWFAYNSGDLLARLRIDGRTGITELPPARVDRFSARPNPFRTRTNVTLVPPAGGSVVITVFDALGQRVRMLGSAAGGCKSQITMSWDGRDQDGRGLPAGAYFIEARAGTERKVVQVLMTH